MNKKTLIYLFSLVLLILSHFPKKAMAQTAGELNNFTPVAGQALSSGQLSSISNNSDLYTGRMNYNFRLADVSMAGINIPIGINYSTTGFKVQEMAGQLGLGWNTTFIAVITRAVVGLADDSNYGYSGSNKKGLGNYSGYTKEFIEKVSNREWDSEPDRFYFSLFGASGSFVLDVNGKPILQSASSGIEIIESQIYGLPDDDRWVLRDQRGNLYVFGEGSREVSDNAHYREKTVYQDGYVSSWFLKKIITSAKREINFTYQYFLPASVSYTNYINMKRTVTGSGCTSDGNATWNENTLMGIITPLYLKSIKCDNQEITFDYNHSRMDLDGGRALTGLHIRYDNEEKQAYSFDLGYFNSDDGTNTKRLKLRGVYQTFLGTTSKKMYGFTYNEQTNLPARNSLKTDYWGYYNANTSPSNIIGESDKTPNFINSKANVLEQVTNDLGGSTYFEFEQNNYRDVTDNINRAAGGLRISKIYEKTSLSSTKIYNQKIYDYSSFDDPSASSGLPFSVFYYFQGSRFSYWCGNGGKIFSIISSESMNQLFDSNGSPMGYSNVTVKSADASAIRYKFTNFDVYPDEFQHGTFIAANNAHYFFQHRSNLPVTSMGFARGKVLTEESINSNGQTAKITTYTYELTPRVGNVVGTQTRALSWSNVSESEQTWELGRYSFFNQDLRLNSRSETYYINNTSPQQLTQTYVYSNYAPNLIAKIYKSNSGNKQELVEYRYAFDIAGKLTYDPGLGFPLSHMVYHNNIANPVEVTRSIIKDGIANIVSANTTRYWGIYPNIVVPYIDYQLEIKAPIPSGSYARYSMYFDDGREELVMDSRMKPIKEYSRSDGLHQTEIYPLISQLKPESRFFGYNGLHKIADVENSSQANSAFTSFESAEKGNWAYSGIPTFDINALTGKKIYNLAHGAIAKTALASNLTYILNYWSKSSSAYTVAGTIGSAVLRESRNGWRNFEHKITGVSEIIISGDNSIDELRLFPLGSRMVTRTYEPFVGVTSETNENGTTTYYTYDEFNKLKFVSDKNKNIITAYSYTTANEPVQNFSGYNNTVTSGTFFKNDCGTYLGTSATYTVEAGRYVASTQQLADAMAARDVAENGQTYANANGTCTNQQIYAKIEYSNYVYSGGQVSANVYIRLYSDAAGTTPYTLTTPLNVNVESTYTSIYGAGGSYSTTSIDANTISQGMNSLFLGNQTLEYSNTWEDPYEGTRTDYFYNSFRVTANGNAYIPF